MFFIWKLKEKYISSIIKLLRRSLSFSAYLNPQSTQSRFRVNHYRSPIESERSLVRSKTKRKALLIVALVSESSRLAFFRVKRDIFQDSCLVEPSRYILEVIRGLQVIPDNKPIRRVRALNTVPDLLFIQVNCLDSKYISVLINPTIDTDNEWLDLTVLKLYAVVKCQLILEEFAFLLLPCESSAPDLWLGLLSSDYHALTVSRGLAVPALSASYGTVTLHLNWLQSYGFRNVGNQVLYVELVLLMLLLNFLFGL